MTVDDLAPEVILGLLEVAARRPDAGPTRDPRTLAAMPQRVNECPMCRQSVLTVADRDVCRQCRLERMVQR